MTNLLRADRNLALLLGGWLLLAVAALWLRPLWPVDETRYASVAWEMWQRGDFLVPHINGEPYSHKPPLLFWIIHLGWALTGVNDWWPRMVGPLFAFLSVPLLLRLAKLLWPQDRSADAPAVWVLFGTALFASFVTLTMFDLLLMLCAMVGMVGVLRLAAGERGPGILWLGAGIGLGVLAKGPVILLHVLPAAVLAPWWAPAVRQAKARWYGSLGLGVLLGAAIALAWAVPAAWLGGEEYRRAILWGQTAGRVSESFAHRLPWWYYVPMLPVILFPWLAWPRVWKGLRVLAQGGGDGGTRFLTAWLVLTVVGFSLVSGKQAKYLVPFLPAFALLAGAGLARVRGQPTVWEAVLPMAGFLCIPAFLLFLRAKPDAVKAPEWVAELPDWPIAAFAVLAVALAVLARRETALQLRAYGFATLGTLALVYAGIAPAFAPYADPVPTGRYLAGLQAQGLPIAHLGKYHAQYNFPGRLVQPIEIVDHPEIADWIAAHPRGRVIEVQRLRYGGPSAGPAFQVPYRGAWLQVWEGPALLAARPELR